MHYWVSRHVGHRVGSSFRANTLRQIVALCDEYPDPLTHLPLVLSLLTPPHFLLERADQTLNESIEKLLTVIADGLAVDHVNDVFIGFSSGFHRVLRIQFVI